MELACYSYRSKYEVLTVLLAAKIATDPITIYCVWTSHSSKLYDGHFNESNDVTDFNK